MTVEETIKRVTKPPFRRRRKAGRPPLLRPGVRLRDVVQLGRLKEGRPFEGAFVGRRRPLKRPLTPDEELERRAVPLEKVFGSILERVVYKEFQRRRLDFDFQSGLLGGRFELGGKVADFIVRWPGVSVIVRVQSFAFHSKWMDTVEDQEEKAELEATIDGVTGLPFIVLDLWEDRIRDKGRLEDWVERHLPPARATGGIDWAIYRPGMDEMPSQEEWNRFLIEWQQHKMNFDALDAAWRNLNTVGAMGEILPISTGVVAGQLVYGNHIIADPRPGIGHFNSIVDATDWSSAQEPAPSATNPFIVHFLGIFNETVVPASFVVLQGENRLQSIITIPSSPTTIDTRTTTNQFTADHQETYLSYWGFDGTGDYLSHADHADFDITGNLTVGGWFWIDVLDTNYQGLIMKDQNTIGTLAYRLYKNNSDPGSWLFEVADATTVDTATSSVTPTAGAWHFIVGRYQTSTEVQIDVDGTNSSTTTNIASAINNSPSFLGIGIRDDIGGTPMDLDGRCAAAFVVAGLLTDTQVANIRTATNGDMNNAAGYWASLSGQDVRGFWISPILNMLEDNGRNLSLNGNAVAVTDTISDWSSRTETQSGLIAVTDSAGLNSTSQGLQCWAGSASDTAYMSRTSISDLRQARLSFRYDPNSKTMATNDRYVLVQALDGSNTVFTAEIQDDGTNYEVRVTRYTDAAATASTAFYDLSDAENTIRIDWESAIDAGTDTGKLALFIGGTLQEELLNIDNDTLRIDTLRVGFVSGVDAGTEGSFFVDELTFDSVSGRRYVTSVDFNGVSNTGIFDCTIDASGLTENTNMVTCAIVRGSCDNIQVDDSIINVSNAGTGGSARLVNNNTNSSGRVRFGE